MALALTGADPGQLHSPYASAQRKICMAFACSDPELRAGSAATAVSSAATIEGTIVINSMSAQAHAALGPVHK
jgi:hypothetical protein